MMTDSAQLSDPTELNNPKLRNFRSWFRWPTFWVFIVGVSAVVVIEGFALSWGGISAEPSRGSTKSTFTTIPYPDYPPCKSAKTCSDDLIQVDFLRYRYPNIAAAVTGHRVKVDCGGPFGCTRTVQSTVRTVHLSPNVKITLLRNDGPIVYYIGTLKELNDYLARDPDGNFFVITGPDSGATALTVEYVE